MTVDVKHRQDYSIFKHTVDSIKSHEQEYGSKKLQHLQFQIRFSVVWCGDICLVCTSLYTMRCKGAAASLASYIAACCAG